MMGDEVRMKAPTKHPVFSVRVQRATLVTPHMKRITIDGSCIADSVRDLPAQWIKVIVPGRDGSSSVARVYTIRRFDRESKELDLDFVLHGDGGPASAWAARANAGDAFAITRPHPRSGYDVRSLPSEHLFLFGDETALPAIGAILEGVPAHVRANAFVEIEDVGEEQDLRAAATVVPTWLHRRERAVSLEEAARDTVLPAGALAVWAAGESSAIRAVRDQLVRRGVKRDLLDAVGYWKRGQSDFHDRDDEGKGR